jgi:hypothetical protein
MSQVFTTGNRGVLADEQANVRVATTDGGCAPHILPGSPSPADGEAFLING